VGGIRSVLRLVRASRLSFPPKPGHLNLAHNQRVGATTKANVLLNLGREDLLDPDGLRRLVRSINRHLGEPDAPGTDAAAVSGTDRAPTGIDGLRLIASRPAGAAWLLHGLWKALDVDTALRKVLGGRRFTTDVERVLFALVANRAIDPSSKLAAAEWASHDVAIPGWDGVDPAMTDDQAYRAMDLLIEADTDAKVQEAVFFAVADLLNLEVDLLFFDTTSTFSNATPKTPNPTRPLTAPMVLAGSAATGTPRITAAICRRSSSGWP
jgi:hypothetical protein